jgi:hypothetical protein
MSGARKSLCSMEDDLRQNVQFLQRPGRAQCAARRSQSAARVSALLRCYAGKGGETAQTFHLYKRTQMSFWLFS